MGGVIRISPFMGGVGMWGEEDKVRGCIRTRSIRGEWVGEGEGGPPLPPPGGQGGPGYGFGERERRRYGGHEHRR